MAQPTRSGNVTLSPDIAAKLAQLERLQQENIALREAAAKRSALSCKVSEKGAISVYGLQRWPVTLYAEQWERLAPFLPTVLEMATSDSKVIRKAA